MTERERADKLEREKNELERELDVSTLLSPKSMFTLISSLNTTEEERESREARER